MGIEQRKEKWNVKWGFSVSTPVVENNWMLKCCEMCWKRFNTLLVRRETFPCGILTRSWEIIGTRDFIQRQKIKRDRQEGGESYNIHDISPWIWALWNDGRRWGQLWHFDAIVKFLLTTSLIKFKVYSSVFCLLAGFFILVPSDSNASIVSRVFIVTGMGSLYLLFCEDWFVRCNSKSSQHLLVNDDLFIECHSLARGDALSLPLCHFDE